MDPNDEFTQLAMASGRLAKGVPEWSYKQLAMAAGRLAEGVPEWSYKPHTDNGIRGFRYESRGKAVAFVTTDYVRVGLADGMVLFDMDITSDDFRFALANAARSADSLSATLLEIENRLSSL